MPGTDHATGPADAAGGAGANGKSVFINKLAGILGNYARSAPIETFTESAGERYPSLAARLQGEWPAILAWMIEGCIEWQRDGLRVPHAIRAATAQYIEAEDAFGLWLGEYVQRRETACETTADLFASWKAWADRAGEHPGSLNQFSQTMSDRGFESRRQPGTGKTGFQGVRLNRPNYTDEPRYGG